MAVKGYYGENVVTTTNVPGGGWTPGAGRDESGYQTSGNGNNQDDQNNQTGETGSSGHKLLDQLNELKAKGMGDTTQAQELERYLSGVETKYQSQGKSLYGPVNPNEATLMAGQNPFTNLTEQEKVWKLASMEAADPKYAKSWEGQEFIKSGKKQGFTKEEVMASDAWRDRFGMPSIVAMSYEQEDPIMTKKRTDEYGQKIPGGDYIYSGLGRALMDQVQQDDFDYGQSKETYWADRAAAESAGGQQGQPSWESYGGESGGGGSGYYGDPRQGNPIERMANYYTPQANVIEGMINVHATPTGFRGPGQSGFQMKRGGIVSLLRLGS